MKGRVLRYNAKKGFGFIQAAGQSQDVFVHINNVTGASSLTKGQIVTFDLVSTPKGLEAQSVSIRGRSISPKFWFSIAVALALLTSVYFFKFNLWLLYFAAINVATFIVYVYDKSVAGTSARRVPEKILHLLALIGGSPMAFVSQRLLRHKTIKSSFQWVFGLTVFAQIAAIAAVLYLFGWNF